MIASANTSTSASIRVGIIGIQYSIHFADELLARRFPCEGPNMIGAAAPNGLDLRSACQGAFEIVVKSDRIVWRAEQGGNLVVCKRAEASNSSTEK